MWIDGDAKRQIQYNSIQLNSIRVVWIDGRGPSYVDTFKNVTGRRTAGSPAGPILWLLGRIGVSTIKGVTVNVTISHVLGPSVLSFAWTPPPIEGFEASAPLVALRRSKSPADARHSRRARAVTMATVRPP